MEKQHPSGAVPRLGELVYPAQTKAFLSAKARSKQALEPTSRSVCYTPASGLDSPPALI